MIKERTTITDWGSDLTLSCEFTGYFPKDDYEVTWDLEGDIFDQDSRKHTINNRFGAKGLSQSGGTFPGPSLISSLTISDVSQADTGIYSCRIIGSVRCSQVIGYIQFSAGKYTCTYLHTSKHTHT